jgi:hypothetical protein
LCWPARPPRAWGPLGGVGGGGVAGVRVMAAVLSRRAVTGPQAFGFVANDQMESAFLEMLTSLEFGTIDWTFAPHIHS